MSKKNAPYRFDIVGSFLRPDYLKKARADFSEGKISASELKSVEDKAIADLIKKQKKAGLAVITDGEFRRSWWHLDFMWGLGGVEKVVCEQGYIFNDEVTRAESAAVIGKISGENHPFIEHFKFVKQFENDEITARQTIPAPVQFLAELQRNTGKQPTALIYSDAVSYTHLIRKWRTETGDYTRA